MNTPDQNAAILMLCMLLALALITLVILYRPQPIKLDPDRRIDKVGDIVREPMFWWRNGASMEPPSAADEAAAESATPGLDFLVGSIAERNKGNEHLAEGVRKVYEFAEDSFDRQEPSEEAHQATLRKVRAGILVDVIAAGVEITPKGAVWLSKDRDLEWMAKNLGDVLYRHTFCGEPIEWDTSFPSTPGYESHPTGHTLYFCQGHGIRSMTVEPKDPKYPGFEPNWWINAMVNDTVDTLKRKGYIREVDIAADGYPPLMATIIQVPADYTG